MTIRACRVVSRDVQCRLTRVVGSCSWSERCISRLTSPRIASNGGKKKQKKTCPSLDPLGEKAYFTEGEVIARCTSRWTVVDLLISRCKTVGSRDMAVLWLTLRVDTAARESERRHGSGFWRAILHRCSCYSLTGRWGGVCWESRGSGVAWGDETFVAHTFTHPRDKVTGERSTRARAAARTSTKIELCISVRRCQRWNERTVWH